MRKITALILTLVLCLGCVSALAETWYCTECGQANSGNFCSNCGAAKPQAGPWTCPECGQENEGNFCSNCGKPKPE